MPFHREAFTSYFQDEDKPRKPREAEFDRPMTKAQKAEYLREKEARERAEMRRQGKEIPPELQQSQSKSKVPNKGAAGSSATPRPSGNKPLQGDPSSRLKPPVNSILDIVWKLVGPSSQLAICCLTAQTT